MSNVLSEEKRQQVHAKDHGQCCGGEPPPEPPHFRGKAVLATYVCLAKCTPPLPAAGNCAKCNLQLVEETAPWRMVVVLTEAGKTTRVEGFRHPGFEVAATIAGAVDQLDQVAPEADALVATGRFAEIRAAAERLVTIGRELPAHGAAKRADVGPVAAELLERFDAIGKAADSGDRAETERALKELRETIAELRHIAG